MNFRGVEKDDSEFIDISADYFYVQRRLKDFGWPSHVVEAVASAFKEMLSKVFLQAGFAKYYNESDLKLLPCPPGTFVNIADTRPRCKDCPAGKLAQILCIKLAHSCIQESDTKNRFKVQELYLKCINLILKCIKLSSQA